MGENLRISFKMLFILILSFGLLLSVSSISAIDLDENGSIVENAISMDIDDNYIGTSNDFKSEDGADLNKDKNKLSSIISVNGDSFEDIQSAIDNASEKDVIELNGTFYGSGERITVNKVITIQSESGAILDGNLSSQIFFIAGDNVILKGLTLRNGITADGEARVDYKGAVSWAGDNGTIENCSFVNNKAFEKGYGAAIRTSRSIDIENCTFINNSGFQGGAIFLAGPSNSIVNGCVFLNNSANESGAIYCGQSNCVFSNNLFVDNFANDRGGAFAACFSGNKLINCSFINNKVDTYGGAVAWCGSKGFLENNTFINNTAGTKGGAICFTGTGNAVNNSIFVNNSAKDGGAIHSYKYLSYVESCIFENNNAETAKVFYGDNFYLKNNFYGKNYISNDEIKQDGLIFDGETYQGANVWVNLETSYDLAYGNLYPIYVDNLVYKSSEGYFVRMPDCMYRINNDVSENTFSSYNLTVYPINPIQYIPKVRAIDTAHIYSLLSGAKILDFNISFKRMGTVIECENMTTTSINYIVDGRKGEYFNVTLKDSAGRTLAYKPIKFGFNGKIYNKTTDENGKASLQINLARSTTYTFAICFLSDDEYYANFTVAKITVNKQTPKLATSNLSYKSSAKTKTITASLKTSRGNPLVNKQLSFTVNGKTYTAKTDSNGIAKVNVSLSVKKTYSFTVKYAGDDTYKAVSKSAKLIIK